MKRLALVVCAVVTATPAWAGSWSPLLDAGVGGGYDDNLNNAASANQREGAAFGTSWITGGAAIQTSQSVRFGITGSYSGTYYADFDDLTVNGVALSPWARLLVREATALTIGASAGRRRYGDEDRNATVYDATLGLRDRITPGLAVTAGYRFASLAAEAATFSSRSHRVSVGGEFTPATGSRFGFGYAVEVGRSVFYQSAATPTPAGGRGRRPSTTFGVNQIAFNADTTTHVVSVRLEQEFGTSVVGHVEYSHSFIVADPGDAHDNLVWAGVAYHY
jgi:hypothetical protein